MPKPVLSKEQKEEARRLRQQESLTLAQIAERLGQSLKSVTNYIEGNGIKVGDRSKNYVKHDDSVVEKIKELTAQKLSAEQIAQKMNLNKSQVLALRRFHGIKTVSQPGIHNRKYTPEQEQKIIELKKSGKYMGYDQIAQELNIPWPTVVSVLKRAALAFSKEESYEYRGIRSRKGHAKTSMHGNLASLPELMEQFVSGLNELNPQEVSLGSKYKAWWRCLKDKGHPNYLSQVAAKALRKDDCPKCATVISRQQAEIGEFIQSLGFEIEHNNRKLLDRLEADIWIPSKNLIIEHDGLWAHSSDHAKFKKNSGFRKWKRALEKKINLFCVFEDEWRDKRPIIESMIRHRLGVTQRRIFARNCVVKQIDNQKEAKPFLEANHIDGYVNSTASFGLFLGNELVGVATYRTHFTKEIELARLAFLVDVAVVGGAQKLIKRLPRPLVSFSNNRFGTGNVYRTLGFELTEAKKSGYFYTDKRVRINRFTCKKVNTPDVLNRNGDPDNDTEELQCREGIQSQKLFDDNRPLFRIEDYGHRKWTLKT